MGNPNSEFTSLLKQLKALSTEERRELFSLLETGEGAMLSSPSEGTNHWLNELEVRGLPEGTIRHGTDSRIGSENYTPVWVQASHNVREKFPIEIGAEAT